MHKPSEELMNPCIQALSFLAAQMELESPAQVLGDNKWTIPMYNMNQLKYIKNGLLKLPSKNKKYK